jgi:hypothetical protein
MIERPTWWTDCAGGVPDRGRAGQADHVTCRIVAVALIAARRVRPAVLVAGCYAAFTLSAVAAQPAGPFELLRDWLAVAGERVTVIAQGVPNLHVLLALARTSGRG